MVPIWAGRAKNIPQRKREMQRFKCAFMPLMYIEVIIFTNPYSLTLWPGYGFSWWLLWIGSRGQCGVAMTTNQVLVIILIGLLWQHFISFDTESTCSLSLSLFLFVILVSPKSWNEMVKLGDEVMPDNLLLTQIKLFVEGHERQQTLVIGARQLRNILPSVLVEALEWKNDVSQNWWNKEEETQVKVPGRRSVSCPCRQLLCSNLWQGNVDQRSALLRSPPSVVEVVQHDGGLYSGFDYRNSSASPKLAASRRWWQ